MLNHEQTLKEGHLEQALADVQQQVRKEAANFTWCNGGETVAFIPSRYPSSELSADPSLRLVRKTEWAKLNDTTFTGSGQRVLATSDNDYALLDSRNINLNTGFDTHG